MSDELVLKLILNRNYDHSLCHQTTFPPLQSRKYQQAQKTVGPHSIDLDVIKVEWHTSMVDLDYQRLNQCIWGSYLVE